MRWPFMALLCCLATAHLSAESLPMYEFLDRLVDESEALEEPRIDVEEAASNLRGGIDLDATRLTVSSSAAVTLGDSFESTSVAPRTNATLSVPVIPWLSLSGQLATDFREDHSGSVTVIVSPLAGGTVDHKTWEAYDLARLRLANLSVSLPLQYESALLSVVTAELRLEISQKRLLFREEDAVVKRELYDVGETDFAALDQASAALIAAQKSVAESERGLLSARKALVELVGLEAVDAIIEAPSLDELERLVDARRSEVTESGGETASISLLTAFVELATLERQLDETPLFDPELSISANTSFPGTALSGSLSITLSPDHWRGADRDDLKEQIGEKREEVALQTELLRMELEVSKRLVSSGEKSHESQTAALSTAEIAHREVEFYHARGERTDLELEASTISLQSAEIDRYESVVALLGVYGEQVAYSRLARAAPDLSRP